MMVVIMLIKLCCDSLSWWINVARLRRRDGAVIASKKKGKIYIYYDSQSCGIIPKWVPVYSASFAFEKCSQVNSCNYQEILRCA